MHFRASLKLWCHHYFISINNNIAHSEPNLFQATNLRYLLNMFIKIAHISKAKKFDRKLQPGQSLHLKKRPGLTTRSIEQLEGLLSTHHNLLARSS